MRKFVIEVLEGQKLTAGTKAKEDVVKFLTEEGYDKISLNVPTNKLGKIFLGKRSWKTALNELQDGDAIVYQYPPYSRTLGDYFINEIKKRNNIKKIMVLHDLNSIRKYKNRPIDKKRELNFLKNFDVVICHNEKMYKWLRQNGCTSKLVNLKIFDYFESQPVMNTSNYKSIVFAGNLGKAKFLSKIEGNTPFELYGVNPPEHYSSNVIYNGSFKSEDLGKHIKGGFGLVWDGESIDSCTGTLGDYMRYNNPHKTSLYLALGLPVVIWKEAALADFICENNLGFTIDSLKEIDCIVNKMTLPEYRNMKTNVLKISTKLRNGYYIKSALRKALE